jgi:beta-glucanase (GH16 family)
MEVDYENDHTAPVTVFDDEFNGDAGAQPSGASWSASTGGNGWGNHELETYTKSPSNAHTDGAGDLDVIARHETHTGPDGITRDYTSARLLTQGKVEFQYGTVEARMIVPEGQGLLSAFWMLGANVDTVGWPLCGEIDTMENLGDEPTTAHGTIHGAGPNGTSWLSGAAGTSTTELSNAFHTYGTVWGPSALAMTLDGRPYMTASSSDIPATEYWSFNHPFYLLLDVAVGGTWPGSPDDSTNFPASMSVDYVRVTA